MEYASSFLAINLPDGQEASFKELQAYGNNLQDFIRTQEARLPPVEEMRRNLTSLYNNQLRIYKAQEAQKQRQFMLGLIQAEKAARCTYITPV
jgi:hypothetical protein